jgi:peptidoglycan/LPS O-acetylase OafA/YrhL
MMLKRAARCFVPQGACTIGQALDASNGIGPGFNTIRFAGAVAVLMTHGFDLTRTGVSAEPVRIISGGQVSFGGMGVYLLFFISGFLVTASFMRAKSMSEFALRRGMRLYPALIVVMLVTWLVLGPLVTTVPLPEYFNDRLFSTFFWNLALVGDFSLPGVFETNRFPGVVNGSLWTLRYEVLCYVLLAACGAAGLLRHRWIVLVAALVVIPLGWLARGQQWYVFPPFGMALSDALRLGAYFVAGTLIYLYRDVIPLDRRMAIGAAALMLIFLLCGGFHLFFPVLGGYLAVYLGMQPALGFSLLRTNDYSYGTYAYAMPVQQFVIFCAPALAVWWFNILLALPLTLLCAVLSWHLIEKPPLSLVRGWMRGDPRGPVPRLQTGH